MGDAASGDKAVKAAGDKIEYTWDNFKRYGVNDGPKAIAIALWVIAQAIVFAERFWAYWPVCPEDKADIELLLATENDPMSPSQVTPESGERKLDPPPESRSPLPEREAFID